MTLEPITSIIDRLEQGLLSTDVRERRDVIGQVAGKTGGHVKLRLKDQRIIPILARALSDKDLMVRRNAAMALRPFVQADPRLLDSILPGYAINDFNGKYTHVGLLDVRTGVIWVPPYQAKGGHAALIADGSTDRYFKFDFHVPGQAPPMYNRLPGGEKSGHLTLYFITDWSYSRQQLLEEFDEGRRSANLRELENFEQKVTRFYRESRLSYRVLVHRELMRRGQKPVRELHVEEIAMMSDR